jgi:hypothetical protein
VVEKKMKSNKGRSERELKRKNWKGRKEKQIQRHNARMKKKKKKKYVEMDRESLGNKRNKEREVKRK